MTTGPGAVGTPPPLLPSGSRALVVGLGASGRAAAAVLAEAGATVTIVDDRRDHPQAEEARAAGHHVVLERPAVDLIDAVDLVVPSPGVPEHAPVLEAATAAGLPIWSEPELGWRLHPHRLLAITGTNGKTSTTELLAAMVAAGDVEAVACGNIGTPFSAAAAAAAADAVLVAELSSFQLRYAGSLRPEVGVLLNLADDHLDWHGGAEAYALAKGRLWEAQGTEDWAVANAADPATVRLRDRCAAGRHALFSGEGPVGGVGVGVVADHLHASTPAFSGPLLAIDALPLRAPHHVANVAAAACAALLAGIAPDAIAPTAAGFRPGRHRLALVHEADGIRWVDDSKATNVHATAAALRSADSLVWLAGGLAKGVDLAALAPHLGAVHDAVLFGTAAAELAEVCASAGVAARVVDTIDEAVEVARGVARPGDTVLLAPACASFDQFRDYAERGDRFAAAVLATVRAGDAAGEGDTR
jgi:UDP-N-acetylmuramoylalanine--D-glutamate ligase